MSTLACLYVHHEVPDTLELSYRQLFLSHLMWTLGTQSASALKSWAIIFNGWIISGRGLGFAAFDMCLIISLQILSYKEPIKDNVQTLMSLERTHTSVPMWQSKYIHILFANLISMLPHILCSYWLPQGLLHPGDTLSLGRADWRPHGGRFMENTGTFHVEAWQLGVTQSPRHGGKWPECP